MTNQNNALNAWRNKYSVDPNKAKSTGGSSVGTPVASIEPVSKLDQWRNKYAPKATAAGNGLAKPTEQNTAQTPDVSALTADYMAARKAEDDAWNAFNQYNNSTHFTQVDQSVLDNLNRNIMDATKAREAAETALKNADALAYNNAYSEAKYANATGVEATGVGKGIMSIGKTIASAPGVITETAKSAIKGEDIDMSSNAMRNMGEAAYLRNAATENAGTVGKFLGNTALSIGQNIALLPMNAVAPGSSLVAMGAISAADKMYELGAQGTNAKEALARGAVAGVIEGLTEKLPLDTLSAMIKSGGKSVAKNLLKQAGVEATEEGVSYFANWVADKLAKDPNATWNWDEFAQSVASGGLSGLFFGLGGTAIGGVNGETAENGENRPTTPTNDVTATTAPSEQKTAPNAVNGAEAEVNVFPGPTAITEKNREDNTLAYNLATNLGAISDMNPVSTLTGREMNDKTKKPSEQIADFFKSLGNKVFRSGFGDVSLGEYGVGGMINHRPLNRAKMVSLSAVPDVIKSGRQIGYDPNWKGRGYASYIFAAPVTVSGQTVYVAAVVDQRPDNKFYLSEMVDSNGNYVRIEESPSGNSKNGVTDGAVTSGDGLTARPEGLSVGATPSAAKNDTDPAAPSFATTVSQSEPVVKSGDTESVGAAPSGFDPYSNMIAEYGIIPEGENPARTVDLPQSTNGKDRVSYTARTAMEAEATPDSAVGELGEAVLNGEFSYIPISNKRAEAAARADLEKSGDFSTALANWTAEVRQGKTSAKLTAMGALLYNESVNSGNTKQAMSILADYAAMVRHGAQAVQAARILKTLSPQNKLLFIQQTVDKMNEHYNGKGLEDLAELKGGINLDTDLINEYLNAKTDEAREAALDKIYQNIADQIPSNLMDKFTALRYLNMLGNLKTQGRNILGNLINKGVRAVDHRLEAVFQAIYHHNDPSKRTTTFFRDPEIAKMAKADFENYRDVVMGEQKYSVSAPSGKLADEIESRRTIFKSNGNWGTSEATGIAGSPPARVARWGMDKVVNPFFEGYRKLTSLAMDKGDEIFSKSAYADAMSRYLKAKGFTAEQWENGSIPQETLDAARQYSIKEAQEATFRDSNAFSDAISKVGFKNPQNGVQKAINVGVQGVIPFRKTPANVAVQAEKHSPLGLVNTAVNAVKASNSNDVDANDVIKSLSETLTGSGLVLLGGALAAAGFATGRKEEDEKLAQIDDLTGGQEYAIVIPGVGSYTYDSLTPASMSFALGVEAYKAFERNGFTPSAFFEAVSGATDIMLNMSMLSGLNDAFENVSYSDTPLVDAALNSVVSYFTQGLTSTLGGQIERIFEEERMTTFRDKNSNLSTSAQYSLGKTSAKTPGWDFQQIPYIDAWGRTEDSGSTVFRAFSNLLSPGYASKENVTEADEEIRRLAEAGYTGAVPSNVEFSKKVDGEYMNSEQYTEYATVKGQTSFDLVSDMILSTVYKGMTDEEKADSIAKAYAYAGHVAAEEITDGKHESEKYVELAQEAQKDLGLSEAEYLLYYMKYGGTIMNGDAIRKAYDMGIEVGDYAEFAAGKSKYDADENSSYTNAEKLKAVEESGFTGEALTALYMITFPDWVNGAAKKGVDFERYLAYKKATNGASKKADKIDALIAAGYNPVQANQMYKEME